LLRKASIGDKRHAYSVILGKPAGNKLLARPRLGWENDIKTENRADKKLRTQK
jgi:hypothetical protein